ncbi:hypothetical protein Q4F19_20615 [Sphingomonas sp. BIUV-7]|uniref:Uncharacterized protein n=1 Tax=Sphingomonas natans TaxID=3063330 RepID=A0ABT8YEM1_9SPHN|nr:hypothetical protein [Sphingomonas sp. BIUV-7]MDO6416798.1 hypothetical protein [Sphingomonas sp. BIUV-7]
MIDIGRHDISERIDGRPRRDPAERAIGIEPVELEAEKFGAGGRAFDGIILSRTGS